MTELSYKVIGGERFRPFQGCGCYQPGRINHSNQILLPPKVELAVVKDPYGQFIDDPLERIPVEVEEFKSESIYASILKVFGFLFDHGFYIKLIKRGVLK